MNKQCSNRWRYLYATLNENWHFCRRENAGSQHNRGIDAEFFVAEIRYWLSQQQSQLRRGRVRHGR